MAIATVEQVSTRARDVQIDRVLLTCLAAALFAIGWTAGKAVTLTARSVSWVVAAVVLGWRAGRPARDQART